MVGQTSPITYVNTKLSYPIFDAEFDPYSRGYLVVAGGGGENRTGVPNKITLLDISSRASVTEVADISLTTQEDSPQTVSSLTTKQGLITFAGISSSVADQKTGKNEHFRSFDVEFPPRKRQKTEADSQAKDAEEKTQGKITEAGKSSLFKAPTANKSKVYQRLLRLSPVRSRDVASKRIGAVAAADAAEDEIVLFDATTFMPNASSVLARLKTAGEAEDMDIYEHSEGKFSLAYCSPSDVYIYDISCDFATKTNKILPENPSSIFVTPTYGEKRPKFRSIRWLGPNHVLLLQNGSPGGTSELIVVCTKTDPKSGPATVRHRLPAGIGPAVRLDVCRLDQDPATGERQIVIAVAAQNRTIHVFTCNQQPNAADSTKQISKLSSFEVLDTSAQHQQSISKICFGNFFPPRQPESSNVSVATEAQYLQLASVSVGYTVSVESFALTSIPLPPSTTPDAPDKKKQPSVRWVLSSRRNEISKHWLVQLLVAAVVLVTAILLGLYVNARGLNQPPPQNTMRQATTAPAAAVVSDASSIVSSVSGSVSSAVSAATGGSATQTPHVHGKFHRIHQLFHHNRPHVDPDHPDQHATGPQKAILVRPGSENPFAKQVHADVADNPEELRAQGAKRFDELPKHEQSKWKDRLARAGKWSQDEGDTVLKGILFSQYAEIVGGAIRDAIL